MPHGPESYREAALEHVGVARELHDRGHFAAAHYWAGLAVECMLRAYRVREDPQFDSRHDLKQLIRDAKFYDFVPHRRQEETAAAVSELVQRWRNDHRFRSAKALRQWLRDRCPDQGVKGDALKYSSSQIVEAAVLVVSIGERRWKP